MKTFTYLAFAFVSTSLFTACSDDHNHGTPEPATFNITAPVANAMYLQNDTIFMRGTMSAPATLHGYDVMIREMGDTTDLFHTHAHAHENTLSVDTFWVNPFTTHTMLDVIFKTYLDHDGNTSADTIQIMAH